MDMNALTITCCSLLGVVVGTRIGMRIGAYAEKTRIWTFAMMIRDAAQQHKQRAAVEACEMIIDNISGVPTEDQ
jgi:hypothetical protein